MIPRTSGGGVTPVMSGRTVDTILSTPVLGYTARPPTGPATAPRASTSTTTHYQTSTTPTCYTAVKTGYNHPPSTRPTYALWILGRATSHLSNGSEMEPSLLTGGTAPLSEAKVGTDPATRAWKGAPSGCTMRSAPAGRTRAHLARRRIAPLHSCARASSMCQ
jgi:hypothetical protein